MLNRLWKIDSFLKYFHISLSWHWNKEYHLTFKCSILIFTNILIIKEKWTVNCIKQYPEITSSLPPNGKAYFTFLINCLLKYINFLVTSRETLGQGLMQVVFQIELEVQKDVAGRQHKKQLGRWYSCKKQKDFDFFPYVIWNERQGLRSFIFYPFPGK